MRLMIALALMAGCGSVSAVKGDAAIIEDDASASDAVGVDAYAATCAAGSFTSSSPVSQLNSSADDTFLRLSPDEHTAYLTRNGATHYATRGSVTAPFGTVNALPNGADQASPSVTADGLTLYFVSARTGTVGMGDVWKATRGTTSADFENAVNVGELNSSADEHDVFVLPDGSAIYFSSARNGSVYEIFRAARNGTGFGTPSVVLSRSPAFAFHAVVAPNERTMLYQNGNDIWLTVRNSTSDAWAMGTNQTALNTVNADNPNWISSDLCRMYFQTNRTGSQGMDFHVTVRSPQ